MSLSEKYKSPFDSQKIESNIYQKEFDSGFFNPDILIEKILSDIIQGNIVQVVRILTHFS